MIELRKINYEVLDLKDNQKKCILNNLNVCFPKNKITVITGHNGSGKSTLIKLLMGIISPTSGEVVYDGKNINNLSISDRANLGFTIAFQQPTKFKGLTVNNLLNLANKKENNVSLACQYLAQVGLCAKDYINRELDDSLSGGELKRIELAISLCKGGEVLLFDEPEAGIDLWSFDDLVNLFKKQKDKTIIIVSHQQKILDIADYVLLLNSKETARFGKKTEMIPFIKNSKCGALEDEE